MKCNNRFIPYLLVSNWQNYHKSLKFLCICILTFWICCLTSISQELRYFIYILQVHAPSVYKDRKLQKIGQFSQERGQKWNKSGTNEQIKGQPSPRTDISRYHNFKLFTKNTNISSYMYRMFYVKIALKSKVQVL